MIKNNINMFSSTKVLTEANKNITLQVNSISNVKKIKKS